MTPHRRRCLIQAILEIRGALDGIDAPTLLAMQPLELDALYAAVAKSFDDANITEPHGRTIESMQTVVMPAVGGGDDDDTELFEINLDGDD